MDRRSANPEYGALWEQYVQVESSLTMCDLYKLRIDSSGAQSVEDSFCEIMQAEFADANGNRSANRNADFMGCPNNRVGRDGQQCLPTAPTVVLDLDAINKTRPKPGGNSLWCIKVNARMFDQGLYQRRTRNIGSELHRFY